MYHMGWIWWPLYLCYHSISHIVWITTNRHAYIVISPLVGITIYVCMSLFHIGCPDYARTYIVPSQLRHNGSPCFSPKTISAYNFFFPIFFSHAFILTQPRPYFLNTPSRAVPSVTYPCVSAPWLRQNNSQIDILARISWLNLQSYVLFFSMWSTCCHCQPDPSCKILYIGVHLVPGAQVFLIIIHFYHTLVIL